MEKKQVDKKLVKVDERGRVPLSSLGADGYYEATKGEDGEIILFPVSVVPAYLARQMREAAGSGALGR